MKITFDNPIEIGDLSNRRSVSSMEVISLSINFAPFNPNNTIISITLRDKVAGIQESFVIEDADETSKFCKDVVGLECPCDCKTTWICHTIERLVELGKLPKGKVSSI